MNTLNKCFMDLVVVGRQSELCVFWCMASAVCFFIIFQYFKGGMSYEKIRCKNFVIIAEFNYGGKELFQNKLNNLQKIYSYF